MAGPRLKDKYNKEIVSVLKDKFQYKSVMQVPKIEKITINKANEIKDGTVKKTENLKQGTAKLVNKAKDKIKKEK